jgi:hypothetical protein
MRISFVTEEPFGGQQRKIAWFALQPKGLYYDVGGLFWGSHTSYHVDGNVFRTSPATGGRPRFHGRQVPLAAFTGWHQLGVAMLQRQLLAMNPALKTRDRKAGNVIREVPLAGFDTETPNLVLELVHDELPVVVGVAAVFTANGCFRIRSQDRKPQRCRHGHWQ